MRKLLIFVLMLGLGIVLVSGCQEAMGPSVTIPEDTLASGLATLAENSLQIDNAIGQASKMTGFKVSALGVHAFAITISRSADGWFTGIEPPYTLPNGITYDRDLNFKVWDTNGIELTNPDQLIGLLRTSVGKIQTASTIVFTHTGGSYTIRYGASKSDPLTFTYSPSKIIDGPVYYLSSYQGSDFQITFDYGSLGLSASGYPSGSVNWATYVDSASVAQGGLSFNGTSTATATFTTGGTGTYYVNLDLGTVAVAGL